MTHVSLSISSAGACMKVMTFTHKKILTRWLKVNRWQIRLALVRVCVSVIDRTILLSGKLLPWQHRQNSTSVTGRLHSSRWLKQQAWNCSSEPKLVRSAERYRSVQPVALLIYTDCKNKRGDLQMAGWITANVSMLTVRLVWAASGD